MTITPRQPGSRSRRLLVVAVASCLVIAACSNSDDDAATPTDGVTEPAAQTTVSDSTIAPATTAAGAAAETTAADTAAETTVAEAPTTTEVDIGEFQSIEGVPGVTDDSINFAVVGTGPANPLGYCLLECYLGGVKAYFEYRNSLGGVNGRQLVVSREDDDELGNIQVKLLDIAGDDSVFGVFAAPVMPVGFDGPANAGMPLYTTFPSSTAVIDVPSSFVPGGISCSACANPNNVYIASLLGKSTIAGLGLGISESSKECVANAEANVDTFGSAVGVSWGYSNSELAYGVPNGLGPEVTAMKDAGVDFIAPCIDQNTALVLEQELTRQGMDDTVVLLPQGYGDADYLSNNAEVLEGSLMGTAFRPFEANPGDSIMPTMLEWFDKVGIAHTDYAVEGWLGADLAVSGILAAGPQFDRASVIDATNALTDYDAGGLLPPMDWATGHQDPGANGDPYRFCFAYLKVAGGSLEMVGDPTKPWYCSDGPSGTYVEPYQLG